MKTLKKSLSLVLALVLALSLCSVAFAGNLDQYSDASKVNYVEAVDVLTGISVVDGMSNGKLEPQGNLTRAQAATIICRLLLGREGADTITASSTIFSDVPSTHYASGYIQYCASQGIVMGRGDGKFDPDTNVTGYEFGKMLLCALGYGVNGEYDYSDWTVNVAKDALRKTVNLYDGNLSSNKNSAATREEAMLYAFNVLNVNKVEWSALLGAYTDTPFLGGNSGDFGTLADVHGLYKKGATDEFGRPSCYQWYEDGNTATKTGGTKCSDIYGDDAVISYTTAVQLKTIYADLGLSKTPVAADFDHFVDGVAGSVAASDLTKYNTDKIGGNGVLTEAYYDSDTGVVTIVEINTYAAKVSVTAASSSADRYITLDGLKYETEDFAKDDIVLYTKANGVIQTVELADYEESLEVTKVTGTSSFVAGGTTFNYNEIFSAAGARTNSIGAPVVKSVLTVYTDNYGYVIYTDTTKGTTNYAYVLKSGVDTGLYGADAYYAQLLLSDGTVIDAKLNQVNSVDADGTNYAACSTMIVKYTTNSDGEYNITGMSSTASTGVPVKTVKGESGMQLGSTTNNYYGNSKTIYLVQTGTGSSATYAAYTGYANVPSMAATNGTYAVYGTSGSVATVVFISGADETSSSKDIVFILATKAPVTVDDSDLGTYYQYKAVINGEITTLDVLATLPTTADVIYSAIVYNSKGIADLSKSTTYPTSGDTYQISGNITAVAEDDTIGINNVLYALSSDVEVFKVAASDRALSASSAGDVAVGNGTIVIITDGEVVSIFYAA